MINRSWLLPYVHDVCFIFQGPLFCCLWMVCFCYYSPFTSSLSEFFFCINYSSHLLTAGPFLVLLSSLFHCYSSLSSRWGTPFSRCCSNSKFLCCIIWYIARYFSIRTLELRVALLTGWLTIPSSLFDLSEFW